MLVRPVVEGLARYIQLSGNLAVTLALPAKINDGIAILLTIARWASATHEAQSVRIAPRIAPISSSDPTSKLTANPIGPA